MACAFAVFNNVEVAADYTRRLEHQFLREINSAPPWHHNTEQLRLCVMILGTVVESFAEACSRLSDNLVSTFMPRAR